MLINDAKEARSKTEQNVLLLKQKAIKTLEKEISNQIDFSISKGWYEAVIDLPAVLEQDDCDELTKELKDLGYQISYKILASERYFILKW